MKICIVSDMHCKYQNDIGTSSDTFLISNKPRNPISQHPISALLETINKEELKSNIVICPGDLGDRADTQGIISSWNFLQEIKAGIGADELLGIPGNHDVNSQNGIHDPFLFIKNFHSKFPTQDTTLNNSFWNSGFCIFRFDKTLILMINTVHDHIDEESRNKSSLVNGALEKIKRELKSISEGLDFKICLMHHHPIKHSNINNFKDSDSIEKGDDLMDLLNEFDFNIVIHGHKHQPRLTNYNGLVVFACGSFASSANLQGTGIQQMFHIIELSENTKRGKIESWEYSIIDGWSKNLNKKFPPQVGFGSTLNIEEVASSIYQIFIAGNEQSFFYDKVIEKIDGIEFLEIEKLVKLGNILKDQYNLEGRPSFPLKPESIGKLIK